MIHFVEALTSFDVGVISTTCNDPVTSEPVTLNGVQVDGVGNPDAYSKDASKARKVGSLREHLYVAYLHENLAPDFICKNAAVTVSVDICLNCHYILYCSAAVLVTIFVVLFLLVVVLFFMLVLLLSFFFFSFSLSFLSFFFSSSSFSSSIFFFFSVFVLQREL